MTDELKNLQAEADAVDAEFIPAGESSAAEQAAPVMDYCQEAKGLIDFAVTLFVPLFPRLANVYTEQARGNLANVSAPLMEKYGWSMAGLFERWGPEINFAMIAFPLGMQTYRAVSADIAARKAPVEKQPQPGSAMGHPGMAQPDEPTL